MTIHFEVPGPPKGKARPQIMIQRGKRVKVTPKDTVQYENLVKLMFCRAAPDHVPFEGPVKVDITAYFPIPKSRPKWWKKAVLERKEPVTTRPDADNILKVVCDALNEIAWKDDRQVCASYISKVYDERPRVVVRITDIERASQREKSHD